MLQLMHTEYTGEHTSPLQNMAQGGLSGRQDAFGSLRARAETTADIFIPATPLASSCAGTTPQASSAGTL